jgi:hypothetical protein
MGIDPVGVWVALECLIAVQMAILSALFCISVRLIVTTMRKLVDPSYLPESLAGAAAMTLCAAPYFAYETQRAPFLCVTLLVICVVSWQVVLAWKPDDIGWLPAASADDEGMSKGQKLALLALATVVVGAATKLIVDPLLVNRIDDYRPDGLREFFITAAWVSTVPQLWLVAMVYAFAYRLLRTRTAALAAVVLCAELVAMLKYGDWPTADIAVLAVIVGLKSLFLAIVYDRLGFAALVATSVALYSRHLIG